LQVVTHHGDQICAFRDLAAALVLHTLLH
jgi:hypothetical protein